MFLDNRYVFIREYCDKLNITINNFSFWRNEYENYITTGHLVYFNQCGFVRKDAPFLFPVDKKRVNEIELTDLTNTIPLSYLRVEFGFNEDVAIKEGLGMVIDICKHKFFKFTDEVVKKMKGKVWYSMKKSELNESQHLIKGYVKVNNNSFITYY